MAAIGPPSGKPYLKTDHSPLPATATQQISKPSPCGAAQLPATQCETQSITWQPGGGGAPLFALQSDEGRIVSTNQMSHCARETVEGSKNVRKNDWN